MSYSKHYLGRVRAYKLLLYHSKVWGNNILQFPAEVCTGSSELYWDLTIDKKCTVYMNMLVIWLK